MSLCGLVVKKTVGFEFSIDDLKAIKTAGRLFNQFHTRKGFFADKFYAEYVLPRSSKEGSNEHALFLTYVISVH